MVISSPLGGQLIHQQSKLLSRFPGQNPMSQVLPQRRILPVLKNLTYQHTTDTDFEAGTLDDTQVVDTSGGEVLLAI